MTSDFIIDIIKNDTKSGCLKTIQIWNCVCVKVLNMHGLNEDTMKIYAPVAKPQRVLYNTNETVAFWGKVDAF